MSGDILKRDLSEAALPCKNCHAVPILCMKNGFVWLECPECMRKSLIEAVYRKEEGIRSYILAEERAIKEWNLRN